MLINIQIIMDLELMGRVDIISKLTKILLIINNFYKTSLTKYLKMLKTIIFLIITKKNSNYHNNIKKNVNFPPTTRPLTL